jgi:hydrogenase maturation factor HypF (carbamoyltransferase family)
MDRYGFLKSEYSSALLFAIQNPSNESIQRVLDINAQLIEEVNELVSQLKSGDSIESLMTDLIKYQKDYAEIDQSQNKITTLKMIYNSTSDQLKTANILYYIYLGLLILLSFVIVYQILRVPRIFDMLPSNIGDIGNT